MSSQDWYSIEVNKKEILKEREKARKIKKSQWWRTKINQGLCHYCGNKFSANELTMDHIVPLARGGKSTAGNVVVSCKKCNINKKLETPAEQLLKTLR